MSKIKILLSDVDGVMTDGGLILHADGTESKVFNAKDGLICTFLLQNNIKLGVITGRVSAVVEKRFRDLKFEFIQQGVENKLQTVLNLLDDFKEIKLDEIAYIGDDINDLNLIKNVGISGCPNDAVSIVKDNANYICKADGGKGAFREFAEYILKLNNYE